MAFAYNNTLKSNRMQLVLDHITNKVQAPSTGTAAVSTLVIGISSLSGATGVLATLALDTTPFTLDVSTPTQPKLTMNDTPVQVNASASGTAALAEIRNTGGTVVVGGLTVTVTAGGGNVELNSVSLTSGQPVSITAGSITHAL
jgi:spore maturation protein SpmB